MGGGAVDGGSGRVVDLVVGSDGAGVVGVLRVVDGSSGSGFAAGMCATPVGCVVDVWSAFVVVR